MANIKSRAIVLANDVEGTRHVTLMVHKSLNMASSVSENTTLLADESIFNDNFDEILQILEEDEFVDKLSDEICVNVSNIIYFLL